MICYFNANIQLQEMDDGHNYPSDDEMEEDEDADEADVEFGEEDTTGSDHTSTDSDEVDAHGDQLDMEAHGGEEGWHDDDDDDDDDGMNEDDEDDEEGNGLNDEAEEQEITWQVGPPRLVINALRPIMFSRMSLGLALTSTMVTVRI